MSFEKNAKLFFELVEFDNVEDCSEEEIRDAAEAVNQFIEADVYFVCESGRLSRWLSFIFNFSRGKAREWALKAISTEEERPDWDDYQESLKVRKQQLNNI